MPRICMRVQAGCTQVDLCTGQRFSGNLTFDSLSVYLYHFDSNWFSIGLGKDQFCWFKSIIYSFFKLDTCLAGFFPPIATFNQMKLSLYKLCNNLRRNFIWKILILPLRIGHEPYSKINIFLWFSWYSTHTELHSLS